MAGAAAPVDSQGATYYVSLGDSLATGYQPDVAEKSGIAYTDRLFKKLKQREPGLQHLRLGCSGETTGSLISGGKCDYPNAKSQLDSALKAMAEHKGRISYVTVNIGANDINGCVEATGALDKACLNGAVQSIAKNFSQVMGALRKAGGEDTRYAGATYYNPFLAAWLLGDAGQKTAKESAGLIKAGNNVISQAYAGAGFEVADVAGAFSSDDFGNLVDLPAAGKVPTNVAKICQLTWQCTARDPHPNADGHALIASAFAAALPEKVTPPQPGDDGGPKPAVPVSSSAPADTAEPKGDQDIGTDNPKTDENLAETGSSSSTLVLTGLALAALVAGAATVVAVRRRSASQKA